MCVCGGCPCVCVCEGCPCVCVCEGCPCVKVVACVHLKLLVLPLVRKTSTNLRTRARRNSRLTRMSLYTTPCLCHIKKQTEEKELKDVLNSSLIYSTLDDDPAPPATNRRRVHTLCVCSNFNEKQRLCLYGTSSAAVNRAVKPYSILRQVCTQRSSTE